MDLFPHLQSILVMTTDLSYHSVFFFEKVLIRHAGMKDNKRSIAHVILYGLMAVEIGPLICLALFQNPFFDLFCQFKLQFLIIYAHVLYWFKGSTLGGLSLNVQGRPDIGPRSYSSEPGGAGRGIQWVTLLTS